MTREYQRPDFEEYAYGALAARLAVSDDEGTRKLVPGALEVLAGSKGLNLGEKALKYHKSFGPQSPEQIASAIRAYAEEFEKRRGEYKPAELAGWYQPLIADLDKEDQDKILATLNEHDETLASIRDEYNKATYIYKAPKGLFSPEQKAISKKIMEKYEKALLTMQTLDNYKFETLRGDAVDTIRKTDLKNLASKL